MSTIVSGAELNLNIVQGASFQLPLEWTNASKVPIPLATYTAKMQIKDKAGGALLLELTTENARIALDSPTTGGIELYIADTDTASISFETAKYDLVLFHTDLQARDISENILFGDVSVRKAITE